MINVDLDVSDFLSMGATYRFIRGRQPSQLIPGKKVALKTGKY